MKGEVTKAVQWFRGFSMLHQGLQSSVKPGPWAACSSKNIRENPMTCRSLMSLLDDLTSAWKYQIPVPCRVEKMPKFCCSHQTSPKTCTFVRRLERAGLSWAHLGLESCEDFKFHLFQSFCFVGFVIQGSGLDMLTTSGYQRAMTDMTRWVWIVPCKGSLWMSLAVQEGSAAGV